MWKCNKRYAWPWKNGICIVLRSIILEPLIHVLDVLFNEALDIIVFISNRDTAVLGKNKNYSHVRFCAMFKTAALMIHDTSKWRGEMNHSVITMEMCSFPIRHTWSYAAMENHTHTHWGVCVCVYLCAPTGLSQLEPRCDPCPLFPICSKHMPLSTACVCIKGLMIVPWCLTDSSPADNQVEPTSCFKRTLCSLLFIPK